MRVRPHRVVSLILVTCTLATAQNAPSKSNMETRQWFQDAKFGMFIYWGVYSVPGRGEWVMENEKIPVAEYEKFAAQFNPTEFNAAEWVTLAKAEGRQSLPAPAGLAR